MTLLDRTTGRFLWWLVSMGVTPSRWPGSACGTILLEVTGRRSGRLRSILVTWAEHGGERYLVTMPGEEPQWARNMKAAGNKAVLRHGRHRTEVSLVEVPCDLRAPILQTWYKTTSLSGHPRQHFGLDPHAQMGDFVRLAPTHPVYRIEPCTETGRGAA